MANNSETVGHIDLRLGEIVYKAVFCNISFSWLLPRDGFKFIFWAAFIDSENDLSFEANFSFFSLAEGPPRDLQITAYKIMVCSCAMPSNCVWLSVWLQIIFCTCVKETVLFSFLRSLLRENGRSPRFPRIFIKKNKVGDRMIKQLLNSVIAKSRDLSVSRRSIICRSRTIDLLATDKSRY